MSRKILSPQPELNPRSKRYPEGHGSIPVGGLEFFLRKILTSIYLFIYLFI